MPKIVYTGILAYGHTNPILPILQERVFRGHEVTVFYADFFKEKFKKIGVDYISFSGDIPTEEEVVSKVDNPLASFNVILKVTMSVTNDFTEFLKKIRPDIILYDSLATCGYMAAESLGLKSA